jgi:uncharacterized protein YdcH (DUF465 family)
MSQFSDRTDAVRSYLDSLRAELHATLAEAGAHLHSVSAGAEDSPASSRLPELIERENQVSEQIAETESARDRIQETENQIMESRERETDLKQQVRDLTEGLDQIYEEIGRIAFDVFRGNPLVDQEYAAIFSPLVEVNSELAGIDASIAEQQALLDERPFLEKMVTRGKIALLKNRRATREGSLRRLMRRAGNQIVGTAFVDEIADPKLTEAAEPYRDRLQKTTELEDQLAGLAELHQNLEDELEQLCQGKRPHKRLDELADDEQTLVRTRDTIRAEMAQSVRSVPKSELPAKCRPLLKRAEETEKRLEAGEALAARLKAAMDAERMEEECGRLEAEIQRKERQQTELKKEITSLKKQRTRMSGQLTERIEARGPAEDLLAEDLLDNLR